MGIIESIKHTFVSENKDVYECENCGEVTKVDNDAPAPSCPNCGSDDLMLINQV